MRLELTVLTSLSRFNSDPLVQNKWAELPLFRQFGLCCFTNGWAFPPPCQKTRLSNAWSGRKSRKTGIPEKLFESFIWRVSLTNIRRGGTRCGGRLLWSRSFDQLLYVVSWSIPLKWKQYSTQTQETQIRLNINRFSKILPNGSQNSQHNKLPSVTLLYSDLGGGMDLRG